MHRANGRADGDIAEREGGRDRETERETEGQRDGETETQRNREDRTRITDRETKE